MLRVDLFSIKSYKITCSSKKRSNFGGLEKEEVNTSILFQDIHFAFKIAINYSEGVFSSLPSSGMKVDCSMVPICCSLGLDLIKTFEPLASPPRAT